jgi:hypothetical protein
MPSWLHFAPQHKLIQRTWWSNSALLFSLWAITPTCNCFRSHIKPYVLETKLHSHNQSGNEPISQSIDWLLIAGTRICLVSAPTSKTDLYALASVGKSQKHEYRLCVGAVETKQPYVYSSLRNVHHSFTCLLCYALSCVMSFHALWCAGIWFYFCIILKYVRFLRLWMLRLFWVIWHSQTSTIGMCCVHVQGTCSFETLLLMYVQDAMVSQFNGYDL